MAGATAGRMLSGAVLLVLIARSLGPQAYGRFVYSFSIAMAGAIVIEYGHANLMMREMGRGQRPAAELLRDVYRAKAVLCLAFALISAAILLSGLVPPEDSKLFCALMLSTVCMTYGDSFNVAFRGVEAFERETANVTAASAAHLAIVAPVAILTRSPLAVGYAYFLSRLFYACVSYRAFRSKFGISIRGPVSVAELRDSFNHLRTSASYFADGGLVSVRGYADVWVVNAMLGPVTLGIYQAVMNLVKAIENLAPVIANVYLPKIAGQLDQPAALHRHSTQLHLLMYGCGTVAAATFFLVPAHLLDLLFGAKYAAAFSLFPYLGMYLLARFVAVSQGVLVTAHGLQHSRTWIGLASLAFLVGVMLLLIPPFSLGGAVASGVFCAQFVAILLFVMLRRKTRDVVGARTFVLVSVAIACAVTFLLGVDK